MFKYTSLITIITVIYCGNAYSATSQPITLESPLLRIADGSFFTADTIELTRQFQQKILAIELGDKESSNSQRIGRYVYDGKQYGSRALASIEKQLIEQKDSLETTEYERLSNELADCLQNIKKDFVTISENFRKIAKTKGSSKPTMKKLIEESCTKHGRPDSLFVILGEATEEDETPIFIREVTSITKFDQLCIDILNFLNDLIHSCPKAQAQVQQRLLKWNQIKQLLPNVHIDTMIKKNDAQTRFMKYLKIHHLDKLPMHEITQKKIQALFNEFVATQNNNA